MNIQILVDNKYRDLYSCYLVKRYVERRSRHRVYLSNKYNYKFMYNCLRPEILVLPHTQTYLTRAIPRFAVDSDVYIMYTEGGYAKEDVAKMIHVDSKGGEINKGYVKRAYIWGEDAKVALLNSGIFKEEQLLVAGNPRFDLYRVRDASRVPDLARRCGIATTLRHITSIHNIPLIRLVRHYSKLSAEDPVYWNEGGQFADFIWFEVATLELINRILKDSGTDGRERRYYLRPHPFESPAGYKAFKRGNDVIIRNNESLIRMLDKVYVYVSAFSTSFADALMYGVPCISMKRLYERTRGELLIKSAIYSYGSDYLAWQPESLDELFDMISRAKEGRLPIAPDMQMAKDYLDSQYNFYADRPATEIVGDDIIKALGSGSRMNRRSAGRLPVFLAAEAAHHALIYRERDYNYSPFRRRDRSMLREVRPEMDRVVSGTGGRNSGT